MNTGIMHLAYKPGALPVCKNRNAFMSTTADRFEHAPQQCKKCLVTFKRWNAKKVATKE